MLPLANSRAAPSQRPGGQSEPWEYLYPPFPEHDSDLTTAAPALHDKKHGIRLSGQLKIRSCAHRCRLLVLKNLIFQAVVAVVNFD
jgi:hypothetical protein